MVTYSTDQIYFDISQKFEDSTFGTDCTLIWLIQSQILPII